MSDLKKYISDLELSEGDNSLHFQPIIEEGIDMLEATEGDEGIMNFKSLNSFVAGVSKLRQGDILDSLLLAQRAATKAFPSPDNIMDWYKTYFEVLDKLGWVFENKDFTVFTSKSNLFEIENAILEILSTALTGIQLDILLKTISAFKALGDGDKRFKAFENNTHSLKKACFQLGVAAEENNTLSIFAFVFMLDTRKKITKIMFFNSEREATDFKYCQTKATLNDDAYNKVREMIKEKLGDVSSFVADLEL